MSTYLLAGQVSELERLKLQSRVWEPTGRRLLGEIGDGRGARAVDIGCGVVGWLRLLSEWVGPDGQVVGTDVDDAMLDRCQRVCGRGGSRERQAGEGRPVRHQPGSPLPSTWSTPGTRSHRWGADRSR